MFGEVEIEQNKIIQFPKGIPGFPEEQQFIFLEVPETPFHIMQSLEEKPYFFVINPFDFFKDYQFDIPDSIVEFLQIEKPEELAVYNIVTIHEDFSQSTANLQAPVLVNSRSMRGKQIVLNQSSYVVRQSIFKTAAVAE